MKYSDSQIGNPSQVYCLFPFSNSNVHPPIGFFVQYYSLRNFGKMALSFTSRQDIASNDIKDTRKLLRQLTQICQSSKTTAIPTCPKFYVSYNYILNVLPIDSIQGDPKFSPSPSRSKTWSAYEKIKNAFSNATYLEVIWRVSCSGIDYLLLSELFTKIDNVSFLMVFSCIQSLNSVL